MKYNFTITGNDGVPDNDKKAWLRLTRILNGTASFDVYKYDFSALIQKIGEKFPDIPQKFEWKCDYLLFTFSDSCIVFEVNSPQAMEIVEYVKSLSKEYNFVFFDQQEDKIYRP